MKLYYSNDMVSLFLGSATQMGDVRTDSVNMVVTSPPYNADIPYDNWDDLLSPKLYREFVREWLKECFRVLKDDGRIAINIGNLGRDPYIPRTSMYWDEMARAGFIPRGEIIWEKTGLGGQSTAWGSYLSASDPCLRDVHEYILIAHKKDKKRNAEGSSKIEKRDFMDATRSVWKFNAQSDNWHPAPFPEELPRRLISLYTYVGDTILDPFVGSGTTCRVAMDLGRRSIGVDNSEKYLRKAAGRCSQLVMTI